jgi:predicted ATPase
MKIKFWNLGSIKEAELDLRPLTVIIGPNNSNKTYIAYSIYGLWKNSSSFFVDYLFNDFFSTKGYFSETDVNKIEFSFLTKGYWYRVIKARKSYGVRV